MWYMGNINVWIKLVDCYLNIIDFRKQKEKGKGYNGLQTLFMLTSIANSSSKWGTAIFSCIS